MFPTTPTTYADLKLRVAEAASRIEESSTGKAIVPTNAHDLDRIERAIREGVEEFASEHSWGWLYARTDLTLSPDGTSPRCVDASPSVYWIDDVVSVPLGHVWWSNGSTGGKIKGVHMDEVVGVAAQDPASTGNPVLYAAEWNPGTNRDRGGRGGIELRVWPAPDVGYVLSFKAKVWPPAFTADDQQGIWPPFHDQTVVAFAVRCLFRHDKDAGSAARQMAEAEAQRRFAISKQRDAEIRAQTSAAPDLVGSIPLSRSVTVNDVDGTRLLSVSV